MNLPFWRRLASHTQICKEMGCFSRSLQWYICFSEYVWRSEYMALSTSLNFMSYELFHVSYSCSRIGLFVVVFGFPKRTKNTHSDGLTIQAVNCTAEIKQNPVRAVVWQFHLRTIYWCWCYTVINWWMLICWYIVILMDVDIFCPRWYECWNWSIKHVYCMFFGTCNRLPTYLRQ